METTRHVQATLPHAGCRNKVLCSDYRGTGYICSIYSPVPDLPPCGISDMSQVPHG